MVIIISRKGQMAERIDKSDFVDEKELEDFINEHPGSILTEFKENVRFLTLNQFPTKVTGAIDVLGIDSDGDIYIVETKLIKNNDRRDVIAQALDYAAALMYEYSDLEFVETLEEQLARSKRYTDCKLESVLSALFVDNMPSNGEADNRILGLIRRIKNNIQNGNFKMIVVMDKVDDRLKDILSFINQKSKFTICAFDMAYYKYKTTSTTDVNDNEENYLKIMVPNSYGLVKKDADLVDKLEENDFFESLNNAGLSKEQLDGLHKIFDYCVKSGDIRWGTRSFSVILPALSDKSLFNIYSNGTIQMAYGNLHPHEQVIFKNAFANVPKISEILGGKGYKMCMDPAWILSSDEFIKALEELQNRPAY